MIFRPSSRFPLAALLLFALLMQALLPAWAAARTASPARWIEVCSVSGLQRIQADAAQDQVQDEMQKTAAHAGADHCALCAASGAVPRFDVTPHLRAGLSDASPAVVPGLPFTVFPGHALRSRAPPAFS